MSSFLNYISGWWGERYTAETAISGYLAHHGVLGLALVIRLQREQTLRKVRGFQVRHKDRKALPGHSHPIAATERNAATENLRALSTILGLPQYDVDISPRTARLGGKGHRMTHTGKDFLVPARCDEYTDPKKGEPAMVVTFCDSDYYIDDFRPYAGNVIASYGLRPNGLSGSSTEAAWRFVSSDTIEERVSGGAVYRHKVWDYSRSDVVAIDGTWGWQCIYDVVPLPSPPEWQDHRGIVVLLPAAWLSPLYRLWRWVFDPITVPRLQRKTVQQVDGYLVGAFGTPAAPVVEYIPLDGTTVKSYALPAEHFQAIKIMATRKGKEFVTAEQVRHYLTRNASACNDGVTDAQAIVTADLMSRTLPPLYPATFELLERAESGIVGTDDAFDKHGVPEGAVPVVMMAYPAKSQPNVVAAIAGRVEEIRNTTPLSDEMAAYAVEFVGLVKAPLAPVSMEEVAANQARPAQRAAAKGVEADVGPEELRSKSFIKEEAGKVGQPRVISTFGPRHNRELSQYTYAMANHLKQYPWYAPGMTPVAIDARMAELHADDGHGPLMGLDASRMDGRVSPALGGIVVDVFGACFPPEDHPLVVEPLQKEIGAKASIKHGKGFKLTGTASGSPVTTIKNSLISAFVLYASRRRQGLNPEQAFASLTLVAGDDITERAEWADSTITVAAEVGMVFEVETAPTNTTPFLSRYYSFEGGSVPTVRRVLGKLPVCIGTNDAQRVKHLAAKVEAIVATDGGLPLVDAYIAHLRRAVKLPRVRWELVHDRGLVEKRNRGAYSHPDPLESARIIAEQLGIAPGDVVDIAADIHNAEAWAFDALREILHTAQPNAVVI